ncbi:hypothetical protein [Sorangium cellulosum]|nr:hypothetical protein [Sorangium cellulosum]
MRAYLVSLGLLAVGCSDQVTLAPPADKDAGVLPPIVDDEGDAGVVPPIADDEGDAGVLPPVADASDGPGVVPDPPVDAGPPDIGCGAPVVVAVGEDLDTGGLAISQGRYAITWTSREVEGDRVRTRKMLTILDGSAREIAPAREMAAGPGILALDDGFLLYSIVTSSAAIQALDLDGRERGPALALPEDWWITHVGREGSIVRVIARELGADGEQALFVADLGAASPSLERRAFPAPDWGAERALAAGRDLAIQTAEPPRVAEISYPAGEIGFERAWDHPGVVIADTQYDAALGEWILLGDEDRVSGGTYSAPVAIVLASDGSQRKIDAPEAPMLRTVKGGLAVGEGSVGAAFWDYHSAGLLWFLRGKTLEPTAARRIEGGFAPYIAWHAPSSTYAVLTQDSIYSTPVTLSLRCGIAPE